MLTYKDEAQFWEACTESLRNERLLKDAIAWIRENMTPEDVFDNESLDTWANNNGYVKEE